jgi:diguanylate cyclase (GGDEF)-like protein
MVSVFFVIIILPVLIIEKPWRSYATIVVSSIITIVAAIVVKRGNASLLFDDCSATIGCMAVALVFVGVIRNLNLHNLQNLTIYQVKARTDELTGVFNHESSASLCETYLMQLDEPCVLFLVDIDNFKNINDTLGHPRGDEVLRQVGTVLKACFRHGDIVGRIGGDEFVVMMKGSDSLSIIEAKAGEIQEGIGTIFSNLTTEKISCSIGISTRSSDRADFSSLYEAADKALYRAKADGKKRFEIYRDCRHTFDNGLPVMLIADDAPDSRAILHMCFKNDYNIIEAANGRQALDMVGAYIDELAVVLLDMHMPEMNGMQVIDAMQANKFYRKIPIVVITAYNETELAALQLGAMDMLEKPFDPEVCRIRVHNAIAKRRG